MFNLSEVHLSQVTFYKIHTLVYRYSFSKTVWCTLQRIQCLFYLVSDSSVIMNSTNCYLVTLEVKAKKAEYNTNLFRIKCVQYWQWHKPESHLKIWISGCAPEAKLPTEPPKKGKFRFSSLFSRIKNNWMFLKNWDMKYVNKLGYFFKQLSKFYFSLNAESKIQILN